MKNLFPLAAVIIFCLACNCDEGDNGTDPGEQDLQAPSNLQITEHFINHITITWNDEASDEDNYHIERSDNIDGSYREIATMGADNSIYVDNELEARRLYYYRVRCSNNSDFSEYSNSVNAPTNSAPNLPTDPSPVSESTLELINTYISCSVSDPDYQFGYESLSMKLLMGTEFPLADSGYLNGSRYLRNLERSRTYYWQVVVYDLYGDSTIGPVWNFVTANNWPTNNPPANPAHGDEWIALIGIQHIPMEMIYISPGSFYMGAIDYDNDAEYYEYPRHEVTISQGYWLGKYEVTEAEFVSVRNGMGEYSDSRAMAAQSWQFIYDEMINIMNEFDNNNEWRLPTEAEWEYACRASTNTIYYWGDESDSIGIYASYNGNRGDRPIVGTKMPNNWGLYDMIGNLWEVCEDDWHWSFEGAPISGIPWVDTPRSPDRVKRGGSYSTYSDQCRSSCREQSPADWNDTRLGFRLVLTDE